MPTTIRRETIDRAVDVESRHHGARRLTEIDVVELECQELVEAIASEQLVRVSSLSSQPSMVSSTSSDIVDSRIELTDATAEIPARVFVGECGGYRRE